MTKILMTKIETGESGFVFRDADTYNALQIVQRLNELNDYTAKLTGEAVKYIYSIIEIEK